MSDKPQPKSSQERLRSILKTEGKTTETESDEAACAAFACLRGGVRDATASVEFRLRGGNSIWFPYSQLGPWQYNPSEGILLRFAGDVVYLVLIRGSNLDKPLPDSTINLTNGGLQRSRILWVKEMTPEEVRRVGESGPTIDSIDIAEFTSQDDIKAWLKSHAPAFVQAGT